MCDHVFGERSGEEGAGEDEETPESAAMEVARWGRRPYLNYSAKAQNNKYNSFPNGSPLKYIYIYF